jgi:23S rRNA (adenine-N6)-dimethyltransferase
VLRERFPGITVLQADATTIPLPGRPFRVVANPPYGISSALLRTLLAPGSRLVAADLVLQRAVVRKHASVAVRRFSMTVGLTLPRRAFLPPPQVDSAVLVVRRR